VVAGLRLKEVESCGKQQLAQPLDIGYIRIITLGIKIIKINIKLNFDYNSCLLE
jgi:hypothetical protein